MPEQCFWTLALQDPAAGRSQILLSKNAPSSLTGHCHENGRRSDFSPTQFLRSAPRRTTVRPARPACFAAVLDGRGLEGAIARSIHMPLSSTRRLERGVVVANRGLPMFQNPSEDEIRAFQSVKRIAVVGLSPRADRPQPPRVLQRYNVSVRYRTGAAGAGEVLSQPACAAGTGAGSHRSGRCVPQSDEVDAIVDCIASGCRRSGCRTA